MVALKRGQGPLRWCRRSSKQERRGGIETELLAEAVLELLKKQERRGGIETAEILEDALEHFLEAGTPWWH